MIGTGLAVRSSVGSYERWGDAFAAMVCVLLLLVLAGYAWVVLAFFWG